MLSEQALITALTEMGDFRTRNTENDYQKRQCSFLVH